MNFLARAFATMFVWGAIFGCIWSLNFGGQHYESPGITTFMMLVPAMFATVSIWWGAIDEPAGCLGNYEAVEDDVEYEDEETEDEE